MACKGCLQRREWLLKWKRIAEERAKLAFAKLLSGPILLEKENLTYVGSVEIHGAIKTETIVNEQNTEIKNVSIETSTIEAQISTDTNDMGQ